MRKIASHYWLRPDGSVGKFPIVVFDDQKRIVEIRERTVFKEEANLELVNGFLIPAFIDFIPEILCRQEPSLLKKYLNRQYVDGARLLGVSGSGLQKMRSLSPAGVEFVEYSGAELHRSSTQTAFQKIQQSTGDSLAELLNFTIINAKALHVEDKYGSLQEGKSPGLLSVSRVDYQNFNVTTNSKLKRIV